MNSALIRAFARTSISSTPFTATVVPTTTAAAQQTRKYANVIGRLELKDAPGSYNKKIRRGRGASSGYGKTAGRGHKGQKQHGKVPRGFNGGQTPDWVVHGKRGFLNHFSVEMTPLNIDRLQEWIDRGRIDPSKPITLKELVESRCLHGTPKDGVKLLARGEGLKTKVDITVSRASRKAIEAVEAAGGKVTTRFYNRHGILATCYPQYFPNARIADATSRKDREYYRDPANRGYLAETLKEGEVPSLFFKNVQSKVENPELVRKREEAEANRLF